ncbi:hypothetical protein E4U41_002316 [Claviceps citrina]|nr:hypothetical protein E4U41_002316 [Claviceps citrina]
MQNMLRYSTILALSFPALPVLAQPVVAQNPPYIGCVVPSPQGFNRPLVVNMANFQKVKATPKLCAAYCQAGGVRDGTSFNYDYPLFAMNNFACYCGFTLASGATLVGDDVCANQCAGDDTATCGGDKAFSLYGDDLYLSVPSYLDGLAFNGCKKYDASKLVGPTYQDLFNMTVNSCASFCFEKHGKNGVTLDKDDNCYCTDGDVEVGTNVRDIDYYCNHPCSGDDRQTCGGRQYNSTYVSHWTFSPAAKQTV